MPVLQQVGELGRSSGENLCVAAVFVSGEIVESVPSRLRRLRRVVEEHHQVAENVQRCPGFDRRPAAAP